MPKINKAFHLEVTVEQFLNACSAIELKELDLLLCSPRYQSKMNGVEKAINELAETHIKSNDSLSNFTKKIGEVNSKFRNEDC